MNKKEFNHLVFGKKPVLEIVETSPELVKVVHLLKVDEQMLKLFKTQKINWILHNKDSFFNNFNSSVNHQGFALQFKEHAEFLKIINFENLEKKVRTLKNRSILLMIDEIMDMQNFGAILRTAYAANVDAVIFKKDNQAQINDYIVKTSMGFISKVPLFPVVNLVQTIKKLKEIGYWIYATALNEKSVNYNSTSYDVPVVLIVGNEQKGVSRLLLENADFLIKIPMHNEIDSLNVSVATGILLFHILGVKNQNGKKENSTGF